MSRSKRKLKIGQSIETHVSGDPAEERRRETRQFVIWTMIVPVVLMVIVVVLYLLKVWG